MAKERKRIEIFTDGAARGNPGPGGYGIVMKYGSYRKEFSQGYRLTTNNRMELLAVIVALEQLRHKNSDVVVYSDSRYVCEAVNKNWIFDWERKGFKKKKNPDLWKRFLVIYRKHRIDFIWIKGHSNHPDNDHCDRLAVAASQNDNLFEDDGYTKDNKLF